MLTSIQGTDSLLASEFKTHDKCYRDYTRPDAPPIKKRCKENERKDSSRCETLRGGNLMRNRTRQNYGDLNDEDEMNDENCYESIESVNVGQHETNICLEQGQMEMMRT